MRRRLRGFSLVETVLALTMLSGMVLVVMLAATSLPRSAQPDRLQHAANLARSSVERMRALPLSAPDWAPSDAVDSSDPELDVARRVTAPETGQRLLEVSVRRRGSEPSLVRLSLLRAEGGL